MDKLYITKSIRSVIADKDTGKYKYIWIHDENDIFLRIYLKHTLQLPIVLLDQAFP